MRSIKIPSRKGIFSTETDHTRRIMMTSQYSISMRRVFSAAKYRKILREWVPFPRSVDVILDVGCGEGTATDFLRKEFPTADHIIGIDTSEEMISIARSSYSNIDFRVDSMNNIPLADERVDFVFSRLAIHYSNDLRQTLAEIARVTKQGGVFFIKDTHPFFATFLKQSFDYSKKEDVTFRAQCDDSIEIVHPTFTFEEYVNTFVETGWLLLGVHEQYGRGALSGETQPYRIPTSVCFVLKKL